MDVANGPLFSDDGAVLYRFAILAAQEALLAGRKWRNAIDKQGPAMVDLAAAERELQGALQSLDIWLWPPTIDGNPIDPRDDPDWRDKPGVERIDVGRKLVDARAGVFSAFGFSGRSAHDVVRQAAAATLEGVRWLRQSRDARTLDAFAAADSHLRSETRGLGAIPAAEADRVIAECIAEAERALGSEKPAKSSGGDADKQAVDARHSPDFRSVVWFGATYSFTGTQAACVKSLWQAWQNETPDVSEATILEEADSESSRLGDVFGRGKGRHPAWGSMIQPGSTKGSFRLVPPEI
jgi:hypothetical protein